MRGRHAQRGHAGRPTAWTRRLTDSPEQGIDYYVWAHAYRDALAEKLSAPNGAELRLHFVIGMVGGGKKLFHPRLAG